MPLLSGLYVITDASLSGEQLVNGVEQAIEGGAQVIQYRNKSQNPQQRSHEAQDLLCVCHKHNIPLIINDDVELAAEIGADGVHLGKDDGDIEQARQRLENAIIGVSCYNDWQQANIATTAGADYIAFGAFFPSSTKLDAVAAPLELLARAKQEISIPVIAIGGITPENGAPLIDAGADMLAVVSGIFGKTDIRAASQRYADLF
jgi:thiamine-phosphate pyrophosphorylase